MSTLSTLPVLFREALAVHAIYAAAGIPAEDIYLVPYALTPSGVSGLGVMAKSGDLDFMVTLTPPFAGMEVELRREWAKATAAWNAASGEERARLRDSAAIRDSAVAIFEAMVAKGFWIERTEAEVLH